MAHIKRFEQFKEDKKSAKLNENEEATIVSEMEESAEEDAEESTECTGSECTEEEAATEEETMEENVEEEYEEMDCSEYEEGMEESVEEETAEEDAEEGSEEAEGRVDELFKSKEKEAEREEAKAAIEAKLDDYEEKGFVVNRELIMKKAEENKYRGTVEARKSRKTGKVIAIYIDGLTKLQKLAQGAGANRRSMGFGI